MSDMNFATRRHFLRNGLTLIGGAATVPIFLDRTALAMIDENAGTAIGSRAGVPEDRVLVVVQLAGGNDGLNTVIPYSNDDYYSNRPSLAVKKEDAHRLDDDFGLHPGATGLKELFDEGLLSIVRGVGYPNPNRSHFVSTDIWMTGDPDERMHDGWLGRYLDCTCNGTPDSKLGIALTTEAPLAMIASKFKPVAFSSPSQLTWTPGPQQTGAEEAFNRLNGPDAGHNVDGTLNPAAMLEYLQRTAMDARLSAEEIQDATGTTTTSRRRRRGKEATEFLRPQRSDLTGQLRMVARMIAAELPTRVYYVSMGGFDTHANQTNSHAGLMQQLGEALRSFQNELKESGHDKRVLTLTFSEFGRRVQQNASGGTDHGTAAPMFVMGHAAKAGLHGEQPSLTDLDRGDLKWKTDFRQVYATILKQWLKADVTKVLGADFAIMDLLK